MSKIWALKHAISLMNCMKFWKKSLSLHRQPVFTSFHCTLSCFLLFACDFPILYRRFLLVSVVQIASRQCALFKVIIIAFFCVIHFPFSILCFVRYFFSHINFKAFVILFCFKTQNTGIQHKNKKKMKSNKNVMFYKIMGLWSTEIDSWGLR